MAKGSKLKAALDAHKGRDKKLEHQKNLQKKAEKRKRSRVENEQDGALLEKSIAGAEQAIVAESGVVPAKKSKKRQKVAPVEDDEAEQGSEGWETDDSTAGPGGVDLSVLETIDDSEDSESDEDQDMNGEDDEEEEEDDEEDIPLSDIESLASEDKGDILPHQRLTINNTTALLKAHKAISLPSKLPFSATQSITTDTPTEIADIEDDLGRELAFYKQSLDGVNRARGLLKAENISFSRPADYFAEMVKSDEHMGKIKQKLVDEAASKKASSEARRQRDLRKFGKQVQVAKLQERDKAKRDTMEKIGLLKRKRQGADIGNANEDDMFDVALEDAAVTDRKDKAARKEGGAAGGRGGNFKRAKRDEKYGFGGKKRFAKSNDAKSSADTRSFSVKKMKSGPGGAKGGKKFRPGKSRRANA